MPVPVSAPLRQMAERIPALVNLSLSHLNADLPQRMVGAEPEAISLLQNFQWPHNYTQFRRVIRELAITSTGQFITAENVRQALRKERHVGTFALHAENTAEPLNLNQTMNEINQDVALRVVAEMGGNQTAAAKRLGISRTTLWRLLQRVRPAADEPASPSGGPHHCLCRVDMNVSLPHPPWTSMPAAEFWNVRSPSFKNGAFAPGMRAKCPVPFGPGHSSFPGGIQVPLLSFQRRRGFLRPSHVFFNRTQMAVFMISGGRNSHSAGRRLYARRSSVR